MTRVQFLGIKPFVSCCKDFEIVFHIPSSIIASTKHYIALCELLESSQFTWVWAGKTVPLEQEGITVKWRKGRVTFANHVLPKLSDDREYYLMYCNEDGTILGESRPFQFATESDDFSSIDLQSTPSEDVIMISMHGKKAPATSSLEVLHNSNDDTASFEVISEQTYSDTVEPTVEEKGETEYFSQSVTSTVVPKNIAKSVATIEGSSTKGDGKLLTSSYTHYHNVPRYTSNQECVRPPKSEVILTAEVNRLKAELELLSENEGTMKDKIIEELKTENAALKEQLTIQTLSNSTVLVNSPKEDREKRILKKRIQDETKKFARLEELLDHKEAKVLQLKNEIANLLAELRSNKEQIQLLSQTLRQTDRQTLSNSTVLVNSYKEERKWKKPQILNRELHYTPMKMAGTGANEEYETLTDKFPKFFDILVDIDKLIPHLVARRRMTIETSGRIYKASTLLEKVHLLMDECIAPPVKGGTVSIFYDLLDVMKQHGLCATQELADEISCHVNDKKAKNERLRKLQHQLKHGDLDSEQRQLLEHTLFQLQHQVECKMRLFDNPTAEQEDASNTSHFDNQQETFP